MNLYGIGILFIYVSVYAFIIIVTRLIKTKSNLGNLAKTVLGIVIPFLTIALFIFASAIFVQYKNKDINKSLDVSEQYKKIKEIKVYIGGREADVTFEDNISVKELAVYAPYNHMPLIDLNNNSKYCILKRKLNTDSNITKTTKKGDIMLYKNNNIIIFYKDAENNYSYTKLGHINNIDKFDMNSDDITLSIHAIHEY